MSKSWEPGPHSHYHADCRRFGDESVCQGVKSHKLCVSCARLEPGTLTSRHFLKPPALQHSCRCYLPRQGT